MSTNSKSVHYDIVGSFLRPQYLKEARDQYANGEILKSRLVDIENQAIDDLVKKEKEVGLRIVTDGEFRRDNCFLDTILGFDGIEATGKKSKVPLNKGYMIFPGIKVTGKIKFNSDHPDILAFKYLKKITENLGVIPRQSIPSPAQFYNMLALDSDCYKSLKQQYSNLKTFIKDLGHAYHDLIVALYDAGCRDIKLDDCTWAALCDDDFWKVLGKGRSRHATKRFLLKLDNAALAKLPNDLRISTHICRGNFSSHWLSSGSYDYVASSLFHRENLNQFFLEYDDSRSGNFKPLNETNPNSRVVLGLITSKRPELEDQDCLIKEIKAATKYVPLNNLAISPQCGFSSNTEGNHLTEPQQWAKIKLVVDTAKKVWG